MISGNLILIIAVFCLVTTAILLCTALLSARHRSVQSRLDDVSLSGNRGAHASDIDPAVPRSPLPRVGEALLPKDESKLSRLRSRLRQAGLYRQHSTAVYVGTKCVLMVIPMVVGVLLSMVGLIAIIPGILFGAVVGLLGNVLPGLWLRRLKKGRQKNIRRALPDALDVIVVCLEGGLSLSSAFARVASELRTVHPLLADEMAIVRREIQLGRSTGEALKEFANRFDVAELRSMASVIIQAERYGASVVKALRVHADTLRLKRYQYAEAMAQKAPVKLIFPTVLCIFPALYTVLMGPAGVQLLEMLDNLG